MRRKVPVILLLLAALAGIWHFWLAPKIERAHVVIGNKSFDLEIADTAQEQRLGLMHRTDLEPCHGMVFVFKESKPVSFWMHDTPSPLWMAFINEKGRIMRLIPRAVPLDETPLESLASVNTVIEIHADCPALAGISTKDAVSITYPDSVSAR